MAETKTARKGYLKELTQRFEGGAGDFMNTWKAGAKRADPVGDVGYHSLELVHGGLKFAARSFARMEKATELPARGGKPVAVRAAPKHVKAQGTPS
jgi:hypothetical protein